MKTITLTESAYSRLVTWKESPRDSFSKVIERVVPARGDLRSVMAALESLPPLSQEQFETIEKGLGELNDWSTETNAWTT